MDFAQAAAAMRRFVDALRPLSGELASSRTGYPLLHELDEIEWPFGDRRGYYGNHPYVRAAERRYPRDPLLRGLARVLFAPADQPTPATVGDVLDLAGDPRDGWTDFGAAKEVR